MGIFAIPVLIIVVLLLRAWFVKTFLPSSLKISYPAAIAANIFSYPTLIISLALVSSLSRANTRQRSYIAAIFIIILSILFDCGVFKYFWKKATWVRLVFIVLVLNTFTWGTLSYIILGCTDFRYDPNRMSCTSNLKQIGLALIEYSSDNGGYLPDKSNAAGLEMLRANDYLTDYGAYVCPVKPENKGQDGQKLTESNVGYIYCGGLRISEKNNEDNYKIPIAWDKPSNHEDYEHQGNVLFLDGHVKGFKGANWMEQAGIKGKSVIREYSITTTEKKK